MGGALWAGTGLGGGPVREPEGCVGLVTSWRWVGLSEWGAGAFEGCGEGAGAGGALGGGGVVGPEWAGPQPEGAGPGGWRGRKPCLERPRLDPRLRAGTGDRWAPGEEPTGRACEGWVVIVRL